MAEDVNLMAEIDLLGEKLVAAKRSITRQFIGQEDSVELALATLLCGGHALLVGLPGLGKTKLVETLAVVMGLQGNRVQFTPDLMPADILGSEILDQSDDGRRSFRFVPGPIFTQLLMADEINRASPRTQSALLQAMQEYKVTTAGQDRPLEAPFHVLATQNPIEQEGTYPLPEAQLDRFLLQINMPYPDRATERGILLATTGVENEAAHAVFSPETLIAAQRLLRQIPVGETVVEFTLDLVRALRPEDADTSDDIRDNIVWGPGPRAAQALIMTSRARAVMHGRLAPSIEDAVAMAHPVLGHRMALGFAPRARGETLTRLIDQTCQKLASKEVAA